MNSVKRTGFKKGEEAPYAVHDVFEYPPDYQPWTFNYKGNGLLYGMLTGAFFSIYNNLSTLLIPFKVIMHTKKIFF